MSKDVVVLYDYMERQSKHASAIKQFQPMVNIRALEVQPLGYSHKGFLVGAAGLGYGVQGYKIPYGYNHKSAPGTEGDRVCAEEHMMNYAFMRGCTEIPSFAIAAFEHPDDHTGRDLNGCLVPCIHCRRKFQESIINGDLISPETIFTSQLLGTLASGMTVVIKKEFCSIEEILQDFPADVL